MLFGCSSTIIYLNNIIFKTDWYVSFMWSPYVINVTYLIILKSFIQLRLQLFRSLYILRITHFWGFDKIFLGKFYWLRNSFGGIWIIESFLIFKIFFFFCQTYLIIFSTKSIPLAQALKCFFFSFWNRHSQWRCYIFDIVEFNFTLKGEKYFKWKGNCTINH